MNQMPADIAVVDTQRLTPPTVYLVRMAVFVVLIGFIALILYEPMFKAFMANPGLNSLIIAVLLVGIVFAIVQVSRLFREVRWVNTLRRRDGGVEKAETPKLLGPIASLLGASAGRTAISTSTLRSLLDSVGMRLDEARDVSRYLAGVLVFLGLLGTFWGLLETVSSVGKVIGAMGGGADTTKLFEELKEGLAAPLAGMGISFSSSLFGLAGSLVLGFLDLQAGQAQNRFYNELEDWLSSITLDTAPVGIMGAAPQQAGLTPELKAALEKLNASSGDGVSSKAATNAIIHLAEGIQGLVQHMRSEQQMIRDWVEAQAEQQEKVKKLLEALTREQGWRG